MKNKEKCSCGCHKEIISAWYRENGVCCNCDILVKPITKPIGKEKIKKGGEIKYIRWFFNRFINIRNG